MTPSPPSTTLIQPSTCSIPSSSLDVLLAHLATVIVSESDYSHSGSSSTLSSCELVSSEPIPPPPTGELTFVGPKDSTSPILPTSTIHTTAASHTTTNTPPNPSTTLMEKSERKGTTNHHRSGKAGQDNALRVAVCDTEYVHELDHEEENNEEEEEEADSPVIFPRPSPSSAPSTPPRRSPSPSSSSSSFLPYNIVSPTKIRLSLSPTSTLLFRHPTPSSSSPPSVRQSNQRHSSKTTTTLNSGTSTETMVTTSTKTQGSKNVPLPLILSQLLLVHDLEFISLFLTLYQRFMSPEELLDYLVVAFESQSVEYPHDASTSCPAPYISTPCSRQAEDCSTFHRENVDEGGKDRKNHPLNRSNAKHGGHHTLGPIFANSSALPPLHPPLPLIAHRACNIIHLWLAEYWDTDFSGSLHMRVTLRVFVEVLAADPAFNVAAGELISLLTSLLTGPESPQSSMFPVYSRTTKCRGSSLTTPPLPVGHLDWRRRPLSSSHPASSSYSTPSLHVESADCLAALVHPSTWKDNSKSSFSDSSLLATCATDNTATTPSLTRRNSQISIITSPWLAPFQPRNPSPRRQFLCLPPLIIAKQMTLLDARLFRAIHPRDVLHHLWSKGPHRGIHVPSVSESVRRFNYISAWVVTWVVEERRMSKRVAFLAHLIAVAQELFELGNFNALMAVLAALHSTPIARLKQTWLQILTSHPVLYERHEALQTLMSSDRSFRGYREALAERTGRPCVPYLGVYLRDLLFLDEAIVDPIYCLANDSEHPGIPKEESRMTMLLPMGKYLSIGDVLHQFRTFQDSLVELAAEVPEDIRVQALLTQQEVLGEEEAYQVSLLLEPR